MASLSSPAPYYPLTQTQKWLLQAALMEQDGSTKAWQQWRDRVDIETLDSDSHHVLSALYPALSKHRVDDPHIARLKGIYRRTWYGNQLLIKQLTMVLQALEAVQVEVLVIGEMALLATCYADYGARSLAHFDLLLSPLAVPTALKVLQQQGWHNLDFNPDARSQAQQSVSAPLRFQNADAFSLCLHNHVFWAKPQAYTDKQLWQTAIATSINGVAARVLSPVDQLLFLCLAINQQSGSEAIGRKQKQPFYCLADATQMIRAIGSEAEWVRLLTQAQRYEAILPLRYLLLELQQLFNIALPEWVMPNLQKMAISYHELLSYRLCPNDKLLRLKAQMVKFRQRWRKSTRSATAQEA
ncbi:MAG: nucleotidyltransferase family protein [Phormidesmis sp.]